MADFLKSIEDGEQQTAIFEYDAVDPDTKQTLSVLLGEPQSPIIFGFRFL